jgi:hypothetical protein
MHLARVMMIGFVVVQVHVHHGRGDRARLHGDCQQTCDNLPHHPTILDDPTSPVKPAMDLLRESILKVLRALDFVEKRGRVEVLRLCRFSRGVIVLALRGIALACDRLPVVAAHARRSPLANSPFLIFRICPPFRGT